MNNTERNTKSIRITGLTSYEETLPKGDTFCHLIEPSYFPSKELEGYVWHAVLQQFVPECLADAEIIIDESALPHLNEEDDDEDDEDGESADEDANEGDKDNNGKTESPTKDSLFACLDESPSPTQSPEVLNFSERMSAALKQDKDERLAAINPLPTEKEREAAKHLRKLDSYTRYFNKFPFTRDIEDALNDDLNVLFSEAGDDDKAATLAPLREQYDTAIADYKNLCRDIVEKVEEVKRLLNDERYDEVDRLYRQLEQYKADIDEATDKIHTEYRKLIAAVSDALEYGDIGGSSPEERIEKSLSLYQDPDSRKSAFAPIRGENATAYAKRLANNKQDKEFPKTLEAFDKHITEVERRWQRVAALSDAEMDVVRLNWRKTIDCLMRRYAIASELSLSELETLMSKGYLTNPIVRDTPNDLIFNSESDIVRLRLSKSQFSLEQNTSADDFEKYAYFVPKHLEEFSPSLGGCAEALVRWQTDAVCATFFCGDSLLLNRDGMNYCNCSLLSDPSPCSINPENTAVINDLKQGALDCGLNDLCRRLGIPFIEVQLHGARKPTKWDMESVTFFDDYDLKNMSDKAIAELEDMEVPMYVPAKDGKLALVNEEKEAQGEADAEGQDGNQEGNANNNSNPQEGQPAQPSNEGIPPQNIS